MTGESSWTWMGLSLSNGDSISLLDTKRKSEHVWANVLHPDGTHTIVEVTPLAAGASDFWTSPDTGVRYPTHWKITIPGLHAELDVTAITENQELVTVGSRYEGIATVTGTYEGRRVTGYTYVEQVGMK